MTRQTVNNNQVWYDRVYRYGDGACPGDCVELGSSHGEVFSSVLYGGSSHKEAYSTVATPKRNY